MTSACKRLCAVGVFVVLGVAAAPLRNIQFTDQGGCTSSAVGDATKITDILRKKGESRDLRRPGESGEVVATGCLVEATGAGDGRLLCFPPGFGVTIRLAVLTPDADGLSFNRRPAPSAGERSAWRRTIPDGTRVKGPGIRLGGTVITNPTKPFWPDEGLTKLDLAQFYARIAGQILPWMKSRAVTMERCPEGIRKSCFYQKQAPDNLSDDVPRLTIAAPSAGKNVDYIVGGTRKTLLTLVNLGCIAMHVMNSRVDELDKPDWLAFDLDPSDNFSSAARAALLLRAKLEDHGLEPYVKTSGGRGLHVFVPLRRGAVQDRVRAYAVAIAGELAFENPRLVTIESRKAKRRAPVYLDIMRNAPGQTIVPPFSVRWRPRAPVSMPLDWDEVSPRLDPIVFNIKTAERRMRAKSPWSSFFGHRQTLPRV